MSEHVGCILRQAGIDAEAVIRTVMGGPRLSDPVFRERGQIGGVRIHLVAAIGLDRATMTAAIICDDSVAVLEKEEELRRAR